MCTTRSGTFLTKLGDGSLLAAGVAVDEASGRVYVADAFSKTACWCSSRMGGGYEQIGEWAGDGLPGEQFGEVTGVAVDNSGRPSAGDVYVVDAEDAKLSEGAVDVFKPKPAGPEEGAEGDWSACCRRGRWKNRTGSRSTATPGRSTSRTA